MIKRPTAKPKTKTNKLATKLQSKETKRWQRLPGVVLDLPHKCSRTIDTPNYISGLILISRAVVHAEVHKVSPQFSLTRSSCKVTIGDTKQVLTIDDLSFMETLSTIVK